MPHRTHTTVECPRWEAALDPSVSGGRCTEPECDAWRWDGAAVGEKTRSTGRDTDGEDLEQGDRVPVEPGDRIDLSGVTGIGVRRA